MRDVVTSLREKDRSESDHDTLTLAYGMLKLGKDPFAVCESVRGLDRPITRFTLPVIEPMKDSKRSKKDSYGRIVRLQQSEYPTVGASS